MPPNSHQRVRNTYSRVPNSPHLQCPTCGRWLSSVNALTKHNRAIHRHAAPANSGRAESSMSFNNELPPSPPIHSVRLGPHQNLSPISSPHFHPQPSRPTVPTLSHESHPEHPPNIEGDLSYLSSPLRPHSMQLSDNSGSDGVFMPDSPLSQIYPPLEQPYNLYRDDSPSSSNDPYERSASPFDLYDPPNSPSPLNPPREHLALPAHLNHDHTSDATDDPSVTKIYHPDINGA